MKLRALRTPLFFLAIALTMSGFVVSFLYYSGKLSANGISGVFWFLSVVCLVLSVCIDQEKKTDAQGKSGQRRKMSARNKLFLLIGIITAVYFITHLYGYTNAPWNNYGLFDDAAWDIYFAKQKCFSGNTFEIIFWDEFAQISRELLFHYYISILFRIFGYNMLVFNMGLVFLGYITVIFTALLAERMTRSFAFGVASGLFLNFFPIHFTQVYMGHRYAICTPVVMVSAYFLWRAFTEEKNHIRNAVVGGAFAGFAMESAIMGKQYIWGLLGSAVLGVVSMLFSHFKNAKRNRSIRANGTEENIPDQEPHQKHHHKRKTNRLSIAGFLKTMPGIHAVRAFFATLTGYAVAAAPLYAYMWTHGELYRMRESSLLEEFFARYQANGIRALDENLGALRRTVFDPVSSNRQFSMSYPILTWWLFLLLLVGILIALRRKWFLPALMVAIPVAGNLVTTCYDFRLLLAAPFAAIMIVLPIFTAARMAGSIVEKLRNGGDRAFGGEEEPSVHRSTRRAFAKDVWRRWQEKGITAISSGKTRAFAGCATVAICLFLMTPSMQYLQGMAKDPWSQHYLNHMDLASARYIQDVVAGRDEPNTEMKADEFNRTERQDEYDVLAAAYTSYAHVHAFLEAYDASKILRLFGDFPYRDQSEETLREEMKYAIRTYAIADKDLVLVFEYDPKLYGIMEDFAMSGLVSGKTEDFQVDGKELTMVRLRVANKDLSRFKLYVAENM